MMESRKSETSKRKALKRLSSIKEKNKGDDEMTLAIEMKDVMKSFNEKNGTSKCKY